MAYTNKYPILVRLSTINVFDGVEIGVCGKLTKHLCAVDNDMRFSLRSPVLVRR